VKAHIPAIDRVERIVSMANEPKRIERALTDFAVVIGARHVDFLLKLMGHDSEHGRSVASQTLQGGVVSHGRFDGGSIDVALETRQKCCRGDSTRRGMPRAIPRRRCARAGDVEHRLQTIPHRLRKHALSRRFIDRVGRIESGLLAFVQRFRPFGLVRFFIQFALLEQRGLPLRTLSVAVRPRGFALSVSVFGVGRRLALVTIALFQVLAIKSRDLLVVGRNGLELLPRGRKNLFVHERRCELG
jgi:hypothetical protein